MHYAPAPFERLSAPTIPSDLHPLPIPPVPQVIAVAAALSALDLATRRLQGTQALADLDLRDPAPDVKDRLVTAMQAAYSIAKVHSQDVPAESSEPAALQQKYGTGLVLDLRTLAWGLDRGVARYKVRARLIRLADAAVIWDEICASSSRAMFTLDELTAERGRRVVAAVNGAASNCAYELSQSLVASVEPVPARDTKRTNWKDPANEKGVARNALECDVPLYRCRGAAGQR